VVSARCVNKNVVYLEPGATDDDRDFFADGAPLTQCRAYLIQVGACVSAPRPLTALRRERWASNSAHRSGAVVAWRRAGCWLRAWRHGRERAVRPCGEAARAAS
jgi:hypothetical protein